MLVDDTRDFFLVSQTEEDEGCGYPYYPVMRTTLLFMTKKRRYGKRYYISRDPTCSITGVSDEWVKEHWDAPIEELNGC